MELLLILCIIACPASIISIVNYELLGCPKSEWCVQNAGGQVIMIKIKTMVFQRKFV